MQNKTLFSQRIRLRHLHCFVAVAQTQYLSRAAEKLNLSQPALSKTLSELERLTQSRLFDRGRQGAQLTPQGERFLSHAVRVLAALDATGHAIADQNGSQQSVLRIGTLPTMVLGLMSQAVGSFQQAYPHIRVQVGTLANTLLLAHLKTGELDLAISRMADPDAMSGLTFELLFLESLVLMVNPAHPLLRETIALEHVLSYPAIVSPRGTAPRRSADNFLAAEGLSLPSHCIETSSLSLAHQLTQQFDYVWFVPSGAVNHDIGSRQLVALPIACADIAEPVGIVTRQDEILSHEALKLIASVRLAAKQLRGDALKQ